MIDIGYHIPITVGYKDMAKHALSVGGSAFAFFTRDPKGHQKFAMTEDDVKDIASDVMAAGTKEDGTSALTLVSHAPYIMNLCFHDKTIRRRAVDNFLRELSMIRTIPGAFYNFHPGSHAGQGVERGIELIVDGLDEILEHEASRRMDNDKKDAPIILLETMSKKSSTIGGEFEELYEILSRVKHPELIGFCMDTCHLFDAGYDIKSDPVPIMDKWENLIGFDKIYAVHLNDSLYYLDAHMDTHARIGRGKIGAESLKYFVQHPALQNLPFILETPGDAESHKKEISMIKGWMV